MTIFIRWVWPLRHTARLIGLTQSTYTTRYSAALLLALTFLTYPVAAAWATTFDCAVCSSKRLKLDELSEARSRTADLLGENRQYMALLTAKEASKFLKVDSNIQFILKKLDSIKRDQAKIESELLSDECLKCRGESKK